MKAGHFSSAKDVVGTALDRLRHEGVGDFEAGELDELIAEGEADIERGEVLTVNQLRESLRQHATEFRRDQRTHGP